MKFIHILNSSIVAGLESLVLPNLAKISGVDLVVFLVENRLEERATQAFDYAVSLGLPCQQIKVKARWDRDAVSALANLLYQRQPEIVHAHDVKASFYLARAKTMMSVVSFKTVSTHHGVFGRANWKLRLYEQYYSRFVLPQFDCALSVCQDDYESLHRRGVPKESLALHPNGVDRLFVGAADKTLAQERVQKSWAVDYNLKGLPSELTLGVVARLSREKNIPRLLSILARLQDQDDSLPWRCLIFGDGPERDSLQAQLIKCRLENRVRFCGYRSSISEEYAGMDLLLSASKGEGLPISFLEAAWAGVPVFASAVGGCKDLLVHGEDGFLFDLGRPDAAIAMALRTTLRDRPRLMMVGQRFQKKITENYSAAIWGKNLVSIYRKLTDGGASL